MKYKLIGKNDYLNPIDTVLQNRGIFDKKSFLNLSAKHVIHHSKLHNIHRAVDCLFRHIEGGGELFVQVDSDPQMELHRVHY